MLKPNKILAGLDCISTTIIIDIIKYEIITWLIILLLDAP
jgi:hypothetical protein